LDGEPGPGFPLEGGPDFRQAIVQMVIHRRNRAMEVDLRPSCWQAHGYDRNPAFKHGIACRLEVNGPRLARLLGYNYAISSMPNWAS
jgi:hypothetical protein